MSQISSVEQIKNASEVAEIPVASTATVYTKSFMIGNVESMGLLAKATSDGSVQVLIEMEIGPAVPTTEGAADSNYFEAEGYPDIMTLVDEINHLKPITPIPMKYARFKLTGQGSNHSSTTVNLKLFRKELY